MKITGKSTVEQIESDERQRSTGREQFEEWVSDDPYAKSIERYPDDPEKFAWPGSYKDINTDLAWQAWQTAWSLGDYAKRLVDALKMQAV